jgi:hypothetical protein
VKNKGRLIPFDGNWRRVRLICNPAYCQSYNKIMLQALERNVPVLTTPGCGINRSNLVTEIKIGNFEDMKLKMKSLLQKTG